MNDNLRVLADNAADRATIVASAAVGALVPDNLKNDLKVYVWRSSTTAASLALTWTEREQISGVAAVFTNFTARAKMRVRGYAEPTDATPDFDTGYIDACPPPALGLFEWGSPLGENFYGRANANLFAYGQGAYGTVWIPGAYAVKRIIIDFTDPNNPDGFLEVSRIVAGRYWTPLHNFDFGHALSVNDMTKNTRSEAGDLRSELGPKNRRLSFQLSVLDISDRTAMLNMIRRNGIGKPFLISMFPESQDTQLEQAYQVWGKLVNGQRLTNPRYYTYQQTMDIEEM